MCHYPRRERVNLLAGPKSPPNGTKTCEVPTFPLHDFIGGHTHSSKPDRYPEEWTWEEMAPATGGLLQQSCLSKLQPQLPLFSQPFEDRQRRPTCFHCPHPAHPPLSHSTTKNNLALYRVEYHSSNTPVRITHSLSNAGCYWIRRACLVSYSVSWIIGAGPARELLIQQGL